MKRMTPVTLFVLMLFLLAACGPKQPESVEPTAVPPTTAPAENPRPTVTNVPNDGYPAPDANSNADGYPVMAETAVPDDYPVIDYEALPTRDPYPDSDEYVWVAIPMGEQCSEAVTYPTEQDAADSLMEEGVAVYGTKTIELMVCTACGCPTSTHFLMQILATDEVQAEELGWTVSAEE